MKKYILITACIICFFLLTLQSNAQQAKVPAAKIAPETEQKTVAQSTATDVKEPAKPAVLPFKKAEATQQVAASPEKPKEEELKGIEVSASTKKGMPIQNADRPKTSTIQPDKKVRPMAATGPAAPNQQK